jgi:hypothetical protein
MAGLERIHSATREASQTSKMAAAIANDKGENEAFAQMAIEIPGLTKTCFAELLEIGNSAKKGITITADRCRWLSQTYVFISLSSFSEMIC